jgi:hypothetical protein
LQWEGLVTSETKSKHYDAVSWLFHSLHSLAVRVLQSNPANTKAKDLLHQLGACHDLFRSLLTIVAKGFQDSNEDDVLTCLDDFFFCLTPRSVDPATEILVGCARYTLEKSYTLLQDSDEPGVDVLSHLQEDMWEAMKTESNEDRWLRLQEAYLSDSRDPEAAKRIRRDYRDNYRTRFENYFGTDEMCANCFVLESSKGKMHFQCSGCHQVPYCSRECQGAHWERAHKTNCHKKK